jgi:FkbM family methyltransferase
MVTNLIRLAAACLCHPRHAWRRVCGGVNFSIATRLEDLKRRGLLKDGGVILDVGAFDGAFSVACASVFPRADIWSFEPSRETFKKLQANTRGHKNIHPVNAAVGERKGEVQLSTGKMMQTNSLLPIGEEHLRAWPESERSGFETVEMLTLDGFSKDKDWTGNIFLKADVQGYELSVLDGASQLLLRVGVLQLECSFAALYEGAPLFPEVLRSMDGRGYGVVEVSELLAPGPKECALSCDVLFARKPQPVTGPQQPARA